MPITYPEGGMPGMTLRQKQQRQLMLPIDTFKVQLVPLRPAPNMKITSPEDVVKLVKEMGDYDREVAKIIHLGTQNQVMGVETISVGSLSASIVHPRETVKGAILNNSASVVFVHNHPSNTCPPSNEDMGVTKNLISAFNTVGIALVDSIIVGKTCYFSFKEHGLMPVTPGSIGQTVGEARVQEDSRVCITSDTQEKVEFIHAVTDYITAPSLEKRKRAADKLQASRYFKEWYETFFYEHDMERAKKNLMKFFGANEEGLGFINYTYYGVISEYLYVISKQVPAGHVSEDITKLPIEERRRIARQIVASTGPALETERKYMTMADIQKLPLKERIAIARRLAATEVAEPEAEFRIGEHVVKDVENDQFFLKHLLEGKGTPEIAQMIKRIMDFAAEHKAVDFRQNVAAKINECLGVQGIPMFRTRYVTPYPPGIVLMVCYGSRGRMHGVWFKNTPGEDLTVLAGRTDGYRHMMAKYAQFAPAGTVSIGGGARFTGQAAVSEPVTNIQSFLTSRTVDTGRHSRSNPVPASAVVGAAVPEDGYLAGYHVTDNPEAVIHTLRYKPILTEQTTVDDLGSGFYVSGVPEYWRVRSTAKWEFAKNLNREQRRRLTDIILEDSRYQKGGGYLADFEVDRLLRELNRYVVAGDVSLLVATGNQPYNVRVTAEIARRAGVPEPKEPRLVKVKLHGKFINAADLYSNPEIENRARDWAGSLEGRKKLTQWFVAATPKNIVNAWLRSLGYAGTFTKSGMSTNPEMVVWDRNAIVDFSVAEPQG